jgi:hypothetical protein
MDLSAGETHFSPNGEQTILQPENCPMHEL